MPGLLSTAISGLQASQNAISTTGHNISNANTDGYSRQDIQFETRPAQFTGSGFIGSGVNTASIERVVNEFLITQLRLDSSAFNELDAFSGQIEKIDSMLADPNTGLSQGFQSFFSSLQNSADDPTSIPSRQLVLTEAESLVTRFSTLHDRLQSVNDGLNQELSTAISQINALSESIANFNDNIAVELGKGQGDLPNDLLDQRDEAIRELSELISVNVVSQSDGKLNVFVGSGQPLVVGSETSRLELAQGEEDPQRKEIIYNSNGATQVVTTLVTGGKVGGLIDFRDSVLESSFNDLGRMAIAMAENINQIQGQGLDLEGNFGSNFFTDINDPAVAANRVLANGDNVPPDDRLMSVEILDSSQMSINDYTFEIEPNSSRYSITRKGTNDVVVQGVLPGTYPTTIDFEGLRLNLVSGSFQGGDEFLLQPTRNGASDIALEITRTEALAFADPITTSSNSGNVGSGTISQGEMLSAVDSDGNLLTTFATAGQLTVPLIIKFTSDTTFDVLDNSNPASPAQLVPPLRNQTFTPGINNTLFSGDPGQTLEAGEAGLLGALGGSNGFTSAEDITFTFVDPVTGGITSSAPITLSAGMSAKDAAAALSQESGVSVTAFTQSTLTGLNISDPTVAQITLNGTNLIDPATVPTVNLTVLPGSAANSAERIALNDYLADQINNDSALQLQGLTAISGQDAAGNAELRLVSSTGEDLAFSFTDANAGGMTVEDASGATQALATTQSVTVGGTIDVVMADGLSMASDLGAASQRFGATIDPQSTYLGYQVTLNGRPEATDTFTVNFNTDGSSDNRNALRLAGLSNEVIITGGLSITESYATLVETVGTESNLARINQEASKSLLAQTQSSRDSVSGVNLDEEAANLIKYEQLYNANARVISIARDVFDTLLGSVS